MTLLTEVIADTPAGLPGLSWPTYPSAKDTRIAEEAIPAGRAITSVGATIERGVLLPTTAAGITTLGAAGISMLDVAKSEVSADYEESEPLTRIVKGRVWVAVEDAVTDGGAVFVRFASGTLGAFRSDNAAGDAAQMPGAVYRSSTSGAGLAVVEKLY